MWVIGRIKQACPSVRRKVKWIPSARALERESPGRREQGALVIPMLSRVGIRFREALLIMLAAVGLVLLISCANIGNLLLAQGVRRRG